MSDELVDALAERLAEVSNAESEKIRAKWAASSSANRPMPARAFLSVQRVVAREVLRQMRWAREQETRRCAEVAGGICVMPKGGERCHMCAACEVEAVLRDPWPHDKGEFPAPPLTLAPDEFQ